MEKTEVKFYPSGDRAVTMEFGREISPEINDRVLQMDRVLRQHPIPGIVETVPTYRSLLILFEPQMIGFQSLCVQLQALLEKLQNAAEPEHQCIRTWKIPCCYGLYFGPDMENVSHYTGLSREEIIRIHSGTVYRIYMLGFLPGFVYLGGMDPRLTTPRLRTPRTAIPKGSVGIGGSQTGIYPMSSPGGWQLIGATPLDLYDPDREDPVFFRAGDRIQFIPITNMEYYDIRRDILQKRYVPELVLEHEQPAEDREIIGRDSMLSPQDGQTDPAASSEAFLEVTQGGLCTTVQDGGRFGYQNKGVPVSGAMDLLSYRTANALVGNCHGEAALEMTLSGGSYRFLSAGRIALTGADMKPKLNHDPVAMASVIDVKKDDVLTLSAAGSGCRTYLAVAGGIQVPEVMGSRSTYARCGIGGYQGRPLKRGDRLSCGAGHENVCESSALMPAYRKFAGTLGAKCVTLRVIPGPQDDYFTETGKQTFYSQEYVLTAKSDRMGCRMDGPVIESAAGTDIISDGIVFGSIQVTGSGKPIVLMADRQTTGGYAKIATVIGEDLPYLAQAMPGTKVRFQAVSTEDLTCSAGLQKPERYKI